MVLFSGDRRELLLPLQTGVHEDPAFTRFLARLRARTGAQRVVLFAGPPAGTEALLAEQAAEHSLAPLSAAQLDEAIALPINALRPGRVYALAELPLDSDSEQVERRAELGIAHARLLRVAPRDDLNGWLLLFHANQEFAAADSALLSAIAPHLAAALETRARIDELTLRTRIAEDALARLGIAQAALGVDGRPIVADAVMRLPRMPLAEATSAREPRLVGLGGDALLLRPFATAGCPLAPCATIAATRTPRRNNHAAARALLARLHGLSPREAALADALSRGEPLVAAGVALGLTPETTRNYSKRIYAKTGTTGQADLVQMVLNGLALLA
ncbi:helix-turn-helix transcriptional regulator [Novosphingobium tardum]|uniref:Helix-turn-helix transcriptional regulator n=1 Tax=Novosphingobium tardum TaxID=1538021 RepID=A0ABV8RMX0_9SPHN